MPTSTHVHCRAIRDADIERAQAAEADLRQNCEQQLLVERQQWCQEKDALQKVLQEQQGTAHSLEQHLNAQIADLQATLGRCESIQENMARTHQDTLSAMQAANEQLQQQQSKLEQDLKAALAYRHKCIQQKQELQLLKQANQAQPPSVVPSAYEELPSDDQQLNLTIERQSSDAGTADADASREDPMAVVSLNLSFMFLLVCQLCLDFPGRITTEQTCCVHMGESVLHLLCSVRLLLRCHCSYIFLLWSL